MNVQTVTATADPRAMIDAAERALSLLAGMDAQTDAYADAVVAYVPLASEVAHALSARQWQEFCTLHAYGSVGALSGQWIGKDGRAAWHALAALLSLADGSADDKQLARDLVMAARGDGASARKRVMSLSRNADALAALQESLEEWADAGDTLSDAVGTLLAETAPARQTRKAPVPPVAAPVPFKVPGGPAVTSTVLPAGMRVPVSASDRAAQVIALLRAMERDGQTVDARERAAVMAAVGSLLERSQAAANV